MNSQPNISVGLATNLENANLIGGEQLLPAAFDKQRIHATPVVWNDPASNWSVFDFVIIRCCWGYHNHIEEFYAWLEKLQAQHIAVLNPPALIRWNAHKKYLLDLQARGIAIPQTTLITKSDTRSLSTILAGLPKREYVIKPCYGASGSGILKVSEPTAEHEAHYRQLLDTGDVLIQAFIPEIVDGEYSAVFIGNQLSHVVIKKPKGGDYRSNYAFGATEKLADPNVAMLDRIEHLYKQCSVDTLYARLDFVVTQLSGLLLMELELIEPYLFLDLKVGAADLFASKFRELAADRKP